jgi:hypothetical protein
VSSARSLALAAAVGAALAAWIATVDGDFDIAPFFAGLTLMAGLETWAVGGPFGGGRRRLAWTIVALWLVAAVWIGGLLLMWQAMCACSYPPRPAQATYLGLTATAFHMAGLFGGVLLAIAAAVVAERGRPAGASVQPAEG